MSGSEWDAATYGRVAGPQFAWGSRVVERVPLAGDEDVLDAGCGTGRVTRLLAERVPDGTVLGVDGSHGMLDLLSKKLAQPVSPALLISTSSWPNCFRAC